jgi:hypothetical protein
MCKIHEQDRVSAETYCAYRGAELRFILFEDVYSSIITKNYDPSKINRKCTSVDAVLSHLLQL